MDKFISLCQFQFGHDNILGHGYGSSKSIGKVVFDNYKVSQESDQGLNLNNSGNIKPRKTI